MYLWSATTCALKIHTMFIVAELTERAICNNCHYELFFKLCMICRTTNISVSLVLSCRGQLDILLQTLCISVQVLYETHNRIII